MSIIDTYVHSDNTEYEIADSATRTRVSAVEGKIPSGASSSNKMATASDVDAKVSWANAGNYVGKNKLKVPSIQKISNLTFIADKDKYVSCADSDIRSWGYDNCNLKFSLKAGTYGFRVFRKTAATDGYNGFKIYNGSTIVREYSTIENAANHGIMTLTFESDAEVGIFYKVGNGSYAFQLTEQGVPIEPYEPYISDNTELMTWEANRVLGAHNIEINNFKGTITENNVTLQINDDKSITVTTTEDGASAVKEIALSATLYKGQTYKIKGCPLNGGWSNYIHYINGNDINITGSAVDMGSGAVFTANETKTVRVFIRINANAKILTPITFYPTITPIEDTDATYSEGVMTNRELTEALLTALFSNPVRLTNANDLDDIKTFGLYSIETSVPTNAPTGMPNTYSCLLVLDTGKAPTQIYIQGGWRDGDKHIAIRGFGGQTAAWSAWRYITDATS